VTDSVAVSRPGAATRDEVLRLADEHRAELLAHCYRMLGDLAGAEDVVQDALVRAWRGWESFEGRSSVRTWLYRIATNLCLTALQSSRRRILPSMLGTDEPAPADVMWIDPIPSGDPADLVEDRIGLRLALIASLQYLPARQRAIFLLREGLGLPAAEIADVIGTTVPGVKSALQRARARLDEVAPSTDGLVEPDTPQARAILDRYVAAFESADLDALADLLRTDATLEVVPPGDRFAGKVACVAQLAAVLSGPGGYRLLPTVANGQPATVVYHRPSSGERFVPFGLAVVTLDARHITVLTTFVDPGLVARFGFPEAPD
jgi:RNA polymerase sigma-70 factor (ECF subfamily)